MAFDGHQNANANSLFHTYQRQAGVNAGGGNGGTVPMPFISTPSASQQEPDTASYVPWSYSTQDDPYELIRCSQPSFKSRTPPENADYDGEIDLQGLVSNILDDADSQDSFYTEGTLPTRNPIWSPKTLSEELLQPLQSDAKMQHNSFFTQNYVSQESFSKAPQQSEDKGVGELIQQSNDLVSNRHWLFNRESYPPHPQKLPPGLPVPNAGSNYTSQMQQSKRINVSSYNKGGSAQTFNNFSDINYIFRPQSEINTPCFESFYEDNYIQGTIKPGNEQYVPEHVNHLVSSFQSLMTHGNDGMYCGDLGNMQKQIVGMHHEDNVAEQWKITSPTMSRQRSPGNQIPKHLMGEMGTVQRERNRVKKQTFKNDGFQDLPDFYPQSTEYVQQPKQFPALLKPPNQYPKKMQVHRGNINVSTNQHLKHQLQNKTKFQVQKEKSKVQANRFLREGFAMGPQFNTSMREGEGQLLSQNPCFDFQETVQYKRFDGQNSMVNAGNVQQFMSFMYPVNDPRRYSGIPVNSSFSPRPYASSVHGMEEDDVMSLNESAAFNSYLSNMKTQRRENTYHGMASAMTTSVLKNHGGPVIQLYFYLDECYEQWRCLEKERKRTEVILTKTFLEKRTPAVTSSNLPKTPPTITRVDLLISNQTKEQAKVASLLEKMECLRGGSLPPNIHTALKRNHMAICVTQARCKEETVNVTKHQWQRPNFTKDRDTLLLVVALKDLAATTRTLCTALWCALQITLPEPIEIQDHHIIKEDTNKEKCPSSFEGYSFRL